MPRLALYLFGPPRLELDEAPVHIPRRKAMALLAYLAVSGQSHSRDTLAALLWPENDQSSARGGLRRMLSEIKRVLGDGWLVSDRETARLNRQNNLIAGNSLWLDMITFGENLNICKTHQRSPMVICPDCLPGLERAVEYYQDDFMAGFTLKDCLAYDEWQFFQREELRGQLAGALERLSSHYANIGEHETAIGYARRRLALDPLHEPAHQQLIAYYDQAGQRAAALRQYQVYRQTLQDELGVEPSEETKNLHRRIQASTMAAAMELRPSSNLPVQSTPFIGRTIELAEIQEKLDQDTCRLLTLFGPGGSGKTRLAIEIANQELDHFKHGVFFVELASLREADLMASTIVASIKLPLTDEDPPAEGLLDYLRNKEMLLVLDNFEHLLDGVGLVTQILNTALGVRILAASRRRLMITGEHLYPVWGMTYPEFSVPLITASQNYSAIRLFVSQAQHVQVGFELTDHNLGDVILICSLLEGMPLAIVLAANWISMLTPAEIATEITQDLAILETDLQDLPQRQRGMRSVFNHSWRLLSHDEQVILSALSVFRGGFTRKAAQKIAGASLIKLKTLTDQSMLMRTPEGRYEIHELVRQFAAERLAENEVIEEQIKREHSHYFCQALTKWEYDLQRWQQAEAQKAMATEIDNIRIAWTWAVERLEIDLLMNGINGLCIFYDRKQQFIEGEAVCNFFVEKLEAARVFSKIASAPKVGTQIEETKNLKLLTRALGWGGFFNMRLGNLDRSQTILHKSLSILDSETLVEQDTRFERAIACSVLPAVMDQSLRDETERLAAEAVQLFRSMEDESWAFYLGLFLWTYDQIITEERWYDEEVFTTHKKMGNLRSIAEFLHGVSFGPTVKFKFEIAEEWLSEALAIYTELDDLLQVVHVYGTMGWQWVWQGSFEEARALYHDTITTYDDLDTSHSEAFMVYAHLGYPDLYLGEYEAARNHVLYTKELLREAKHFHAAIWKADCLDILGKVTLAEGSIIEAEQYFQDCLRVFRDFDHREKISGAWACLGYIARARGEIAQGQGLFFQAFEMGTKLRALPTLAHALPGIALLFADQGDNERAVEIYTLSSTLGMVANSRWFADIAGDEIGNIAERMPSDVVEAAKGRVQAPVSWERAEALLAELKELGWDVLLPPTVPKVWP